MTTAPADLRYIAETAHATWGLVGATALLVIVQLLFMRWQVKEGKAAARERKIAAQVNLGLRLYSDFESPAMSAVRSRVAGALLNNARGAITPNDIESILERLEGVAGFARRGLLDQEWVSFDFTYAVRCYWHEFVNYVREQREKRNDPALYEDVEWLYREFAKEAAVRHGRDATEAHPTEEEIKAFLISEADANQLILGIRER